MNAKNGSDTFLDLRYLLSLSDRIRAYPMSRFFFLIIVSSGAMSGRAADPTTSQAEPFLHDGLFAEG